MTLDEAIKHAEEVAEQNKGCQKCAEEHRQLAKWLKALRDIKNAMPDILITEYEAYVYHKLLEMGET